MKQHLDWLVGLKMEPSHFTASSWVTIVWVFVLQFTRLDFKKLADIRPPAQAYFHISEQKPDDDHWRKTNDVDHHT